MTSGETPSLTIDMVHQYAYCPRRMHLMYVDGRWEDNLFTDQGRSVHARLDGEEDPLPPADGDPEPVVARSVALASERLGFHGKLDLLEVSDGRAVPVDTKRGSPPDTPEQCYEPERVQLMCQGLLLREHGHVVEEGMLFFAAARRRVSVPFTPDLEARTLHLVAEAVRSLGERRLPSPLVDSPKCPGCSLAGICLPDETNLLLGMENSEECSPVPDLRRLYPAREDALPLYVQEQGSRVGKSGEALEVSKGKVVLTSVPLKDVSQLVLCGAVGITAPCLHLLCERGIPVVHLSQGHWFYGLTAGFSLRNAYARAAQFAVVADEKRSLEFARAFVLAKARNQRTLLRRNSRGNVDSVLEGMRRHLDRISTCLSVEELLGHEGRIAACYFGAWTTMLPEGSVGEEFFLGERNRRPPRDPLNALLSFGYALLAKEATVALWAEGLDPFWGFLHRPRHGKPALALDLMEEFRPLVVDSAVLSAINTHMVEERDFVVTSAGCALRDGGRKALIRAYELRMDQMVTHPVFDYRCSWRAVLRLQARLLAKVLRGELHTYTGITTR